MIIVKNISEDTYKKIQIDFSAWYMKYCGNPPFFNFSDNCLSEYIKIYNTANEYSNISQLSKLTKIQKKTFLTIYAFLFHYYKYYLGKGTIYQASDNLPFSLFLDDEKIDRDNVDKIFLAFEKGIKKIELANEISGKDEYLDFLFPRTFRLIYSDKAEFLNLFYGKKEDAFNIFNFLFNCEVKNIIKFSISTRLSVINLLLYEDNPNIDLILKYYNEVINYPEHKLFNEQRLQLTMIIAKHYIDNSDYDKALSIYEGWEEYCRKYELPVECNLLNEKEKCVDLINQQNDTDISIQNEIVSTLNEYFDDNIIQKMSTNVSILLNTSIKMYKYFFDEKEDCSRFLDYSPVNVSGLKAMEEILFQIVGVKYLDYLNNLDESRIRFYDIPNGLKNTIDGNSSLKNAVDFLEYGDAIYAFCKKYIENNETIYRTRASFKYFCCSNGMSEERINEIPNFTAELDKLRVMRNSNSHKNRVIYVNAKECKELLFDTFKIIEKIYNIFDVFLDNVDE